MDNAWFASKFPGLTNWAKVGSGGQKIAVMSAVHPENGNVVVKLLKPATDAETVSRELKAIAKYNGTRVPQVFETGTLATELGECFWYREQHVPGGSLKEKLQAGRLAPVEVLRLGLQVLQTLAAVDKLVHRDIKPDNIICHTDGSYWLIDFGIARHLDMQSHTADSALYGKGTVGYSAPEQLRNKKKEIDGRSDLFALGVTLYECIARKNPFVDGARSPLDVLKNSETRTLPSVTLGHSPEVDAQFQQFLAAITQARRDLRPSISDALVWITEICKSAGVA